MKINTIESWHTIKFSTTIDHEDVEIELELNHEAGLINIREENQETVQLSEIPLALLKVKVSLINAAMRYMAKNITISENKVAVSDDE